MKNLVELCHEYGIPLNFNGERWTGPCPWSFDEPQSLEIDLESDRWEDWITGFAGNLLEFVLRIEERLAHLGRPKFAADDWFAVSKDSDEPLPW